MALFALLLLAALPAVAQEEEEEGLSEEDFAILSERIVSFLDETNGLMDYIGTAQAAQLQSIHHFADIINTRWKGFMQQEQEALSMDDSLMVMVSEYEQTMQMVSDSIASREKTLQLLADFVKAEKFFAQHLKEYDSMYDKAMLLSLTPKTADELAEHKTREQLLFTEIQQFYDKAKAAVEREPRIKKRMDKMQEQYIKMKTLSEKIQAAEYKSPIARFKDYLLSLACVAILLMFLNMVTARIKAAKQARKAAMDMKKMMEMQNNDIPTI